jgi:hypothetical protein
MRYFCVSLLCFLASAATAQEQTDPTRTTPAGRSGAPPSRFGDSTRPLPAVAGKPIAFEILIADTAEPVEPATAARILELEKAGKLSSASRYQLSSLENMPAHFQFGERAPRVVGRTMTASGSRGGFGGPGGAGPPAAMSTPIYNDTNVGTLVQATARIEDDGSVVAQLMVERSGIVAARDVGFDPNGGEPLQGMQTLTNQTTARFKPGEPQLIGGRRATAGKETTQTWIVATVIIGGGK